MSIQSNQQFSNYVFSKVIKVWNKTLENKTIAKERQSSTKRMNRVQNIRIEICK